MARTIKTDNALRKRFSYAKNKKKEKREIITYFLIVCEGEKTEPNYFKSFPKRRGIVVYDLTFAGGGINTLQVVEKAIELSARSPQKYDRVWAVFDRDSFKANQFNSAIQKAKAKDIRCAWSNEAFELWYLLHFHNRVTPMRRDEYKNAIEDAVNTAINNNKKHFNYAKNDTGMYHTLNKYGRQTQAIHWAEDLLKRYDGEQFAKYNPATTVHRLVKELIGESEELQAEIMEKFAKGE